MNTIAPGLLSCCAQSRAADRVRKKARQTSAVPQTLSTFGLNPNGILRRGKAVLQQRIVTNRGYGRDLSSYLYQDL